AVAARGALGQFYLDDAKPFEALWALRDVQRRDPKALKPMLLMARALEMAQLYQPAVATLQSAVRDHPEGAAAPQQLAFLQLSLARPAAAVATLQALQRRRPLPKGARLLLGRALEASGRDAEALRQYQRCRQAEAEPGDAFFRIVRLLLRTGETAEA